MRLLILFVAAILLPSMVAFTALASGTMSGFHKVVKINPSSQSDRFYFYIDGGDNGCTHSSPSVNGKKYYIDLDGPGSLEMASVIKAAFLAGKTADVGYDANLACSNSSRKALYVFVQ